MNLESIKRFKKHQLKLSFRRKLRNKFFADIAKSASTGQPLPNKIKSRIKSFMKEYDNRLDKLKKANTFAKARKIRNKMR